MSYLADLMLKEAWVQRPEQEAIQRLRYVLPELLKDFALQFGIDAPSQRHRDITVFIHKYRE